MDLQILIAPVVGGVIGYTTNWLAIKMLFKPHKAYHIGKLKIPFTPGLIPRERNRIAKSLGTTVGENLLTDDVILKELTNEKIIDSLKEYVVDELLSNEFSINELITNVYDNPKKLYKIISNFICNKLTDVLETNMQLKGVISSKIAGTIAYDSSIIKVIGDKNASYITNMVMTNKLEIANGICLFLEEEETATKLKSIISNILSEKLGPMASMFVEPNSLYESILDFVRTKLEQEENQEEVVNQINNIINKLMNKQMDDIFESDQYVSIIEGLTIAVEEQIIGFVKEDSFELMIESMISNLADSKLLVPEHMKDSIKDNIERMYIKFATTRLPIFLEHINVSDIVENEINHFSVKQVEDLIFGIVDKELKAITWLGALLGIVMGTITIFF